MMKPTRLTLSLVFEETPGQPPNPLRDHVLDLFYTHRPLLLAYLKTEVALSDWKTLLFPEGDESFTNELAEALQQVDRDAFRLPDTTEPAFSEIEQAMACLHLIVTEVSLTIQEEKANAASAGGEVGTHPPLL